MRDVCRHVLLVDEPRLYVGRKRAVDRQRRTIMESLEQKVQEKTAALQDVYFNVHPEIVAAFVRTDEQYRRLKRQFVRHAATSGGDLGRDGRGRAGETLTAIYM